MEIDELGAEAAEEATSNRVVPEEAAGSDERIGIMGFEETFSSRVACLVCVQAGLTGLAVKIAEGALRSVVQIKPKGIDRYCHQACRLGS